MAAMAEMAARASRRRLPVWPAAMAARPVTVVPRLRALPVTVALVALRVRASPVSSER
jgi:hypothetical protein